MAARQRRERRQVSTATPSLRGTLMLLGVAAKVGSLEVGKDADLALFSRHPLDTYTLVDATWIDGALVFDRATEGTPDAQP